VTALTRADSKDPALKALQGALWRKGFEDGTLRAPLFKDVTPRLRGWTTGNAKVRCAIFSSGSVEAQKMFLAHTGLVGEEKNAGDAKEESKGEDVTGLMSGYFDTVNAGPKKEAESYVVIAKALGATCEEVLFLSDNVAEIRAAMSAAMKAFVVDRPGNAPLTAKDREELVVVTNFEQIDLE